MTGIAWYNGKFLSSYTLFSPVEVLRQIDDKDPKVILLERFPRQPEVSVDVLDVYIVLEGISVLISPGNWKPFMRNRKRNFPEADTRHERDAINMLRYYLIIGGLGDVP